MHIQTVCTLGDGLEERIDAARPTRAATAAAAAAAAALPGQAGGELILCLVFVGSGTTLIK